MATDKDAEKTPIPLKKKRKRKRESGKLRNRDSRQWDVPGWEYQPLFKVQARANYYF